MSAAKSTERLTIAAVGFAFATHSAADITLSERTLHALLNAQGSQEIRERFAAGLIECWRKKANLHKKPGQQRDRTQGHRRLQSSINLRQQLVKHHCKYQDP